MNKKKADFPDGSIDRKEFVQLYRKYYQRGNPDAYAKFAFEAFDDNNSGKITFNEFLLATSFLYDNNGSNDQQRHLELLFDVFDVNDDQKVDRKELQKLLDAVYSIHGDKAAAKQKAAQLFGTYDRDGSSCLNKQEFITALLGDNFLERCQF